MLNYQVLSFLHLPSISPAPIFVIAAHQGMPLASLRIQYRFSSDTAKVSGCM